MIIVVFVFSEAFTSVMSVNNKLKAHAIKHYTKIEDAKELNVQHKNQQTKKCNDLWQQLREKHRK